MKRKTIIERIIEEAEKNKRNALKAEKLEANLDYVAMMSDIELDEEVE